MSWKDLSELHLASLATDDDTLFDRVMQGKIAEAIWKIDQRKVNPHLFKSDTPMPSEFDLNKSFPVYKARGIKELNDEKTDEGWLCPLFMRAGEITLFGGEAKRSGKTTFYSHMLKCVHDGTPFMGMPTIQSGSLVLTEQGANILEAIRKAGIEDDDNIYFAFYKDLSKEDWSRIMFDAVAKCEDLGVKILCVDTFTAFAKLRGSDENLSGEIIERMEPVLEAARVHDVHVSILHHTGKDGEIRGSSAFSKDPDVIWVLKRPHGDHGPNVRALEGCGRYDEVNTSFNIALESTGYVRLGTSSQIERAAATNRLIEEIPIGKDNAKRRTSILDVVSSAVAVSDSTIQRALEDLIDKHLVLQEKLQAKGSPVVLWRPDSRKKSADHLFKSDTEGIGEPDLNKSPTPENSATQGSEDGATHATLYREIAEVAALDSIIEDDARLIELVRNLESAPSVALDLETMPPPGWKREVLEEYCSQLAKLKKRPKVDKRKTRLVKTKERIYKKYAVDTDAAMPRILSIATDMTNVLVDVTKIDPAPLLEVLQDKTLITHNGAFDLGVLRSRYGYVHKGKVHDTQLLYTLYHYAEGGERSRPDKGMWKVPDPRDTRIGLYGTGKKDIGMTSLAHVAHKHLGVLLDKDSQKSDWSVPRLTDKQVGYALKDTSILLELVDVLTSKLHDLGMGSIVKLEARAFPAMVDMSLNGFPASREVALGMAEKYRVESEAALKEVEDLLPQETAPDGSPWNWNADAHIRAVLKLLGANLDKKSYPKTEKTRDPSTSADALRTIKKPAAAKAWVDAYLKYGALRKQYNDFARQYASLIRPDGTIKGSFDTVSTGRLSCRKPNLQQVPSRGERQSEGDMRIRDIFRPKVGEKFIVADFSQVELLIAGTIAARETGERGHMLEVFQKGDIDVHTATAATMMGKPPSKVTKAERTLAKAVNFGLVYGAQAETLLEYARNNYGIVDMSLEDAQEYRRAFFERYPELAAWHRLVEARCEWGEQYSKTPLGRLRKLPKWMSSGAIAHTTAKNSPVQGAAADTIKLAMAKLFEDKENCPGNPRLNASVHDEVVLSVEEDHVEAAVEWVRSHMASAEREAVADPESPIVVDVEPKDSWA
jgi:DNA polymerase I-like protein with 3'-5' exonuclease and polymerase domains